MRISKFIKLEKNILLEYIYDDDNNISERYKILKNIKDGSYTYISNSTSNINNINNQLIDMDLLSYKSSTIDTERFNYLKVSDYPSGFPVNNDIVRIHFPFSYTFDDHLGFRISIYTFDTNNEKKHYVTNYFYDISDVNRINEVEFSNPVLYFNEKNWAKYIELNIPSINSISKEREGSIVKENSLNFNLTNGVGLSNTSPIFIEFSFIESIDTLNNNTDYILGDKLITSLPQKPEFEKIGVKIEHSKNGDYFEIYGTFNNNISEFKKFIDDSLFIGNKYHVEYILTIYEENIRGKSIRFYITDNFNEKVEYRPIIKYSTTTALINVEMRLINIVDETQIIRKASYGMLQDEVAKYSLRMMKIDLLNANKPKIYNIKSPIGADIFSNNNVFGTTKNNVHIETIKVPFPVLIDKFNIVSKSDSVRVGKELFYGNGKLKLVLYPFDNIVKLVIATMIEDNRVDYMDLSSYNEIRMVFKNDFTNIEFDLYMNSGSVDLKNGVLIFKISENKIRDIKKMYEFGINTFYITTSSNDVKTSIYSGLFKIFDSSDNIIEINNEQEINEQSIIEDEVNNRRETAVVTVRTIETRN